MRGIFPIPGRVGSERVGVWGVRVALRVAWAGRWGEITSVLLLCYHTTALHVAVAALKVLGR